MTSKLLLTVAEVAEQVHAEERTVRMWTRSGILRGCKVGRRWLYEQADVDAFVDNGQSKARASRRRRRAAA